MREIKFRGKHKNPYGDKWVYGYYAMKDGRHIIVMPHADAYISSLNERKPIPPISVEHIIDVNTLGQYTGLKDENGKEIYEGDIIDFSYDMFVGDFNTYVAKGIVIFEEGAFYVQCLENENMTKDESYLLYTINIDTIEIIGNIYDNPELLEKGKE